MGVLNSGGKLTIGLVTSIGVTVSWATKANESIQATPPVAEMKIFTDRTVAKSSTLKIPSELIVTKLENVGIY